MEKRFDMRNFHIVLVYCDNRIVHNRAIPTIAIKIF